MSKLTWHKGGTNGTGNGVYETSNRKFRCMFNYETGLWQLLTLDEDNGYEWAQSYGLLRDAKEGAEWCAKQEREQRQLDAFAAYHENA